MDTIKQIKQKHNQSFAAVSFIGKKGMCAQPGALMLRSSDFIEYCKHLRENNECTFYLNARKKNGLPTVQALQTTDNLQVTGPHTSEHILSQCTNAGLCPYEVSLELARKAKVIIMDYNYLFNPKIRDVFLAKIGKSLEDGVVIIDEGHNLPERIRDANTAKINSFILQRALKEAKKYELEDVLQYIVELQEVLNQLSGEIEESLISKEEFTRLVEEIMPYDQLIKALEAAALLVREQQKQSSLATIADFLTVWVSGEEGYVRILRVDKQVELSFRCLDPSACTKEVIDAAHSTIIMSGTLTPTHMFHDLLGFDDDASQNEFPSPFPQQNKLALIVPRTTTKYSKRDERQYQQIAKIIASITDLIPGCSAVFFPSYALLKDVNEFFVSKKTIIQEAPGMTKQDKQECLDKLVSYKEQGAVLFGVAAGSFGEGVDLPGVLKCVIVVGLPLDRPTLEVKELIKYYDMKFGKGWEYGYTLPALTRTLQNAGRCIRSEKDRGVLIFLDERYAYPQYSRCFPADWHAKITLDYENQIKEFFS